MPDYKEIFRRSPCLGLHILPFITWLMGGMALLGLWLLDPTTAHFSAIFIWLFSGAIIGVTCYAYNNRLKNQPFFQQSGCQPNIAGYQAQDNLRYNQSHIDKILNNLVDAVCVIDQEFTIQYANASSADLFNRPTKKLIGEKCFNVWQTPFCGTNNCSLLRIRAGEKSINDANFKIKKPTGEQHTLAITASVLNDNNGNGLGIIKTFRQQNPQNVGQSTTLPHSTHELNNNLAAVIGYTDLAIQQTTPGSTIHENLHKSLDAAQKSQALVKELSSPTKKAQTDGIDPSNVDNEGKQRRQPILGGDEKILFVDDEEILVTMTRQIMEELGYQFHGETSSIAAMKHFEESPDYYDLVITDQSMPHLTGIKMAENMLKIRPNLPVIIYTGYSDEIDQEWAKSIGIKDFIFKPVTASTLTRSIREILDRSSNSDKNTP